MWEKFLVQGGPWVFLAAVSGLMLLWGTLRAPSKKYAVSVLQATELINQSHAWIVDVRPTDIVAKGRFPNARPIPFIDLKERIKELEKAKAKPIVVLCDTGRISYQAAKLLRAEGFDQAVCVNGGLNAWVQAGLMLSTKA